PEVTKPAIRRSAAFVSQPGKTRPGNERRRLGYGGGYGRVGVLRRIARRGRLVAPCDGREPSPARRRQASGARSEQAPIDACHSCGQLQPEAASCARRKVARGPSVIRSLTGASPRTAKRAGGRARAET